ncbi:MAG: class I SAM-dependent methyltransferase [Bryobacteraceae bacterium]
MSGSAYANRSKLRALLGNELCDRLRGKVVIDFGCGSGRDSVEMARRHGVRRVIGIDIQEPLLDRARELAASEGVSKICEFGASADARADVIVSVDAFEHFADPAAVLDEMWGLLKPGGTVLASFGPTWYHPLGGHLFSVFPWAHLVFSESGLIRWRSDIRRDGAARFSEVAGGLNRMTIGRFERIVRSSRFRLARLETVPIRSLRMVHTRITREFTTAIVRAVLAKT